MSSGLTDQLALSGELQPPSHEAGVDRDEIQPSPLHPWTMEQLPRTLDMR